MRRALRAAVVGSSAVAVLVAAAGVAPAANAASGRAHLNNSQPSWAKTSALQGRAAATDVVHARVYLPWHDQAGLDKTAHDVSTPGTASYGHFLSPAQFRQRFAPTASEVSAVKKWLTSAGFSVADVPQNNHYVAVEGTVAQAQQAFGVTLGEYSAYGHMLRAPEGAPTVPADVAPYVATVVGLDDSAELQVPERTTGNGPSKQGHGAPGAGFRVGTPCSTYWAEKTVTTSFVAYDSTTKPLAPCGYTPAQVRGLYGLGSTDTGAGQTVAFVGANASPTLKQDVTQYSRLHNLPDPSITEVVAPGVYRHPNTPQQVPGDYYGEETLDAEAIHTTAPEAKLLYVASSNAYQDFDASVNHIVDRHLASILSISYGFTGEAVPQGFINSLNATFQEAVATGVGVFVSSGDDGDDATDFGHTAVDFYADSPNVTAVGGTSVAITKGGGGSIFSDHGTAAAIDRHSSAASGGIYGIDDAANEVNQPGWRREFAVGWQTGFDPIGDATLTPETTDATAYTLTGNLATDPPGEFFGGGGGGVSTVFPQPSYQKGVTDDVSDGSTGAKGTTGRAVPDISALADPNTGFLVGQTQQFSDGVYYDEYRIGGTSVAAPLMAGMAAVANEKAGHALGFLNPRIYALAHSPSLYDVNEQILPTNGRFGTTPSVVRVNYVDNESSANKLSFSLRTLESPEQSLHSGPGYDTATGVGTPGSSVYLEDLGNAK